MGLSERIGQPEKMPNCFSAVSLIKKNGNIFRGYLHFRQTPTVALEEFVQWRSSPDPLVAVGLGLCRGFWKSWGSRHRQPPLTFSADCPSLADVQAFESHMFRWMFLHLMAVTLPSCPSLPVHCIQFFLSSLLCSRSFLLEVSSQSSEF